jgi:signal transduction histidine kinase
MDEEGGEDFASLSNIYYRMAKAYDYDKAYGKELQITAEWLKFLHEKVGKVERADVRECYHSCYLARAAAFIGMKKMDDARMALDTASHHAHIINTVLGLHHYYKMQARYFLAKGDAAKALLYTDSVTMTTSEKDTHLSEIRAQALMMLGRGADAARIYEQLYHEKDSVFSRDARQHLDELNTLFQLDELKTEQQHTKFKYIIITVSSVMLALLVLLLYGWYTAIRQKKVNRQLRIANKKAKTSARMKSEFIRNVSHEIRTPLNILSGFTQILTKPGLDLPEAEMADVQARIEENAERITKLVDQVLELSDISSEVVIERNDHINAQEILKQAIDSSKIALHTRPENADSAVEFKMAGEQTADSVELITNKVYAIRALSQILENASKFTSEGCIILQMEYTESKVRFVVEDTGVGISADEAEHIFDEFVQLDEFADGIGIGLTVARSIAQRMGGNLWLDTDYSHGARFILELLRI